MLDGEKQTFIRLESCSRVAQKTEPDNSAKKPLIRSEFWADIQTHREP